MRAAAATPRHRRRTTRTAPPVDGLVATAGDDGPAPATDDDGDPVRLLLLGGGSGGHVLPGLAVADALGDRATCVAACSERPVDARILEAAGVPYRTLPATPPAARPAAAIRFVRGWRESCRRGAELLREHEIDVVLATGGFVSPPVAAAARRAGIPVIALCLDAVPGRAIRLVGRLAARRLAGSPVADGSRPWRVAEVTGVPVRRDAIAPGDPGACRTRLGLDPSRPTLLVTGASQGARTIDELAPAVATREDRPLAGWQVVHLTGGGDPEPVEAAWSAAGVPAVVLPFLHEIGLAWGAASLAISRAGAGSVAEAAANRVPTLFLPYPWHADEHQRHNAEPLAGLGGAVIARDEVDLPRTLAGAGATLASLATDPDRLAGMRSALGDLPPAAAAAEAVARHVLDAACGPRGRRGLPGLQGLQEREGRRGARGARGARGRGPADSPRD